MLFALCVQALCVQALSPGGLEKGLLVNISLNSSSWNPLQNLCS